MSHYLADLVAPLDALLLRGDADPATRAIMSAALVLAGAPEAARLTDAFERASRAVPRMRQRVVVADGPLGRAKWVPDDAVRRRRPRTTCRRSRGRIGRSGARHGE